MATITRELPEEGATAALASSLAMLLRPGDVLALQGPLGAGKTTLTRALASALGVDPALVASPTFVLMHVYPTPATCRNESLRTGHVVHVDAYRLTAADDLEPLGWDQMFDPATGRALGTRVALVEWPERLGVALPGSDVLARIVIEPTGLTARRVTIHAPDAWASRPEWERFAAYAPVKCATTGTWVEPLNPAWPFRDERARFADLYGWMTGQYGSSRPAEPDDA